MKNNSLIVATAVVVIAGTAAIGGYIIDRQSTQTQMASTETWAPPHSVTVPPPGKMAMKSTTTVARPAPAAATASAMPSMSTTPAQSNATLRGQADRSLVALNGTVMDKKGDVLMLKEASGPVRVVVQEDAPSPRDIVRPVRAMDKIEIGAPVTVYGKLRTNESMPKIYADAIYTPGTKTLYQLNGDKPAEELTSAEITSRYTPVGSLKAAKITVHKTTATTATKTMAEY